MSRDNLERLLRQLNTLEPTVRQLLSLHRQTPILEKKLTQVEGYVMDIADEYNELALEWRQKLATWWRLYAESDSAETAEKKVAAGFGPLLSLAGSSTTTSLGIFDSMRELWNEASSAQTVEKPASKLTIANLTDNCLLLCLKQFSLEKCISLRRVCTPWKSLIEANILQSKRSIKYFSSDTDVTDYREDITKYNLHRKKPFQLRNTDRSEGDLVCRSVEALFRLPSLFPSLRRLTIYHYNEEFPWQTNIGSLLERLPQLEELIIFGLNSSEKGVQKNFWSVLNAMPNLRELHLFDMAPFLDPEEHIPKWAIQLDARILGRLTKFSLVDYPGPIDGVLQLLGSNVTELVLANFNISNEKLASCLEVNSDLPLAVTKLTIGYASDENFEYDKLFELVRKLFTNLTHLDVLAYREIRLQHVLTPLAGLSKLCELSIHIGFGPTGSNTDYFDFTPPLETVCRLFIKDYTSLDPHFILKYFWRVFPKINYFQLDTLAKEMRPILEIADIFHYFRHLNQFELIAPDQMGNMVTLKRSRE